MASSAKKVAFYKDGDVHFSGVNLTVGERKYANIDSLFDELSRKVPLPFGVRTIYTPGGHNQVKGLNDLKDGQGYVCSSNKKIKKLNYVNRPSRKPFLISSRVSVNNQSPSSQRAKSKEDEQPLFTQRYKTRAITFVAKENSENTARYLISSKVTKLDTVLKEASDLLKLDYGPVQSLCSIEGNQISTVDELFQGRSTFIAYGRLDKSSSARSLPVEANKSRPISDFYDESASSRKKKRATGKAGKTENANGSPATKSKNSPRKPIRKYVQTAEDDNDQMVETQRGDTLWLVTVKTSDIEDAGSDNTAYITLYGDKGKTSEINLGVPAHTQGYYRDSINEAEIKVEDVGNLYKIRIGHDDDGVSVGWHLENVLLTNLETNKEYSFDCNEWLSREKTDGEIVREFAIKKDGDEKKPQNVTYEVTVYTGDRVGAGSDANAFINIVGENGDTGKRKLAISSNELPMQRGGVDVFSVKAISLGFLTHVVISHDNKGQAPGWYLEKINIKETDNFMEYSFPCNNWLDAKKGDKKIERVLEPESAATGNRDPSPVPEDKASEHMQELPVDNKLEAESEVKVMSKLSGKALCYNNKNQKLHGTGQGKHCCSWTIGDGKDMNTRLLFSVNNSGYLAIDENRVELTKGNPGLLNEFYVSMNDDGQTSFESVVYSGIFLGCDENGQIAIASDTVENKWFNLKTKGSIRDNTQVNITSSKTGGVLKDADGLTFDKNNAESESLFVIKKIGPGIRALRNKSSGKYIQVSGSDTVQSKEGKAKEKPCWFKISKKADGDTFQLESCYKPGFYLCTKKDKLVLSDTSDDIGSSFIFKVIKGGKQNDGKDKEEECELEAEKEEIPHEEKKGEENEDNAKDNALDSDNDTLDSSDDEIEETELLYRDEEFFSPDDSSSSDESDDDDKADEGDDEDNNKKVDEEEEEQSNEQPTKEDINEEDKGEEKEPDKVVEDVEDATKSEDKVEDDEAIIKESKEGDEDIPEEELEVQEDHPDSQENQEDHAEDEIIEEEPQTEAHLGVKEAEVKDDKAESVINVDPDEQTADEDNLDVEPSTKDEKIEGEYNSQEDVSKVTDGDGEEKVDHSEADEVSPADQEVADKDVEDNTEDADEDEKDEVSDDVKVNEVIDEDDDKDENDEDKDEVEEGKDKNSNKAEEIEPSHQTDSLKTVGDTEEIEDETEKDVNGGGIDGTEQDESGKEKDNENEIKQQESEKAPTPVSRPQSMKRVVTPQPSSSPILYSPVPPSTAKPASRRTPPLRTTSVLAEPVGRPLSSGRPSTAPYPNSARQIENIKDEECSKPETVAGVEPEEEGTTAEDKVVVEDEENKNEVDQQNGDAVEEDKDNAAKEGETEGEVEENMSKEGEKENEIKEKQPLENDKLQDDESDIPKDKEEKVQANDETKEEEKMNDKTNKEEVKEPKEDENEKSQEENADPTEEVPVEEKENAEPDKEIATTEGMREKKKDETEREREIGAPEDTQKKKKDEPEREIGVAEDTHEEEKDEPEREIGAAEDTHKEEKDEPEREIGAQEDTQGEEKDEPEREIGAAEDTHKEEKDEPEREIGAAEDTHKEEKDEPEREIGAAEDTHEKEKDEPEREIGAADDTKEEPEKEIGTSEDTQEGKKDEPESEIGAVEDANEKEKEELGKEIGAQEDTHEKEKDESGREIAAVEDTHEKEKDEPEREIGAAEDTPEKEKDEPERVVEKEAEKTDTAENKIENNETQKQDDKPVDSETNDRNTDENSKDKEDGTESHDEKKEESQNVQNEQNKDQGKNEQVPINNNNEVLSQEKPENEDVETKQTTDDKDTEEPVRVIGGEVENEEKKEE
ncbi:myb-like protein X isoform X2 [Hydractinia symbiolongicarpus]|uniref:myb-like protein X isoform X2 n=1 Tax=Hydractinia symbiolongicarpus TaxID=13093 RepID=UPI00254B4A58|nr:myb-like protein X isoform X2 [Hydractinia symbiolongicarpus]